MKIFNIFSKKMKIYNTYNEVIYKGEADSFKQLVEMAVSEGVCLSYANLEGVDLAGANLAGAKFFVANFEGANLEGAILTDADLRHANLGGANLKTANLEDADLVHANLTKANLEGAILLRAKLVRAHLNGAYLKGANLAGANLRFAYLLDADLTGADLVMAKLRFANLKGVKLSLDIPIIEDIHQKVYEAASREGALNMREWHTCDTTHCIAGWVITLAGEQGKILEDRISTATAATLIYIKSDRGGRFPDFYGSNKDALKQLKQLAEGK